MKKGLLSSTIASLALIASIGGVSANWNGFSANNGIITGNTPVSSQEAVMSWNINRKADGVWGEYGSIVTPVIAGDYIYTATDQDNQIIKLDKAGNIVKTGTISKGIGYLPYLCYGDNKIFITLEDGTIQAFDANTLDSLWVSARPSKGNQAVSPIIYHDGYIYSAATVASASKGSYFALTTKDDDPNNTLETKDYVWQDNDSGFYNTGGLVYDGYLYYGNQTGLVICHNLTDNAVLSYVDLGSPIRSTVVETNGYLYVVTNDGTLHKLSSNNGILEKVSSLKVEGTTSAASTPTIADGRIYFGVNASHGSWPNNVSKGYLAVVDESTFEIAYTIETPYEVQGRPLVNTSSDENVVYFTCNGQPGGIYTIKDKAGNTNSTLNTLYTPAEEYQDYCITSVIGDGNTLYYRNDSGTLFAIDKIINNNEGESNQTPDPSVNDNKPDINKSDDKNIISVKTGDDVAVVLTLSSLIISGGIYLFIKKAS